MVSLPCAAIFGERPVLTAVAGTDMARDDPEAKYCMTQYLGTKKTIPLMCFSGARALSCKLNRNAIQWRDCPLTLCFTVLFQSRICEFCVVLFPSCTGKNPATGGPRAFCLGDRITQYLQNRGNACVAGSRERHAGIPQGLPHPVRCPMRYARAAVVRH